MGKPHRALEADLLFLPRSKRMHPYLDRAAQILDMNVKWRDAFAPRDAEMLDELMGETLKEFGYPAGTLPLDH